MRKALMLVEFSSCEVCPYYESEYRLCTYVKDNNTIVEDPSSIPDFCPLPKDPTYLVKSCCLCRHYDLSLNLCKLTGVKILARNHYCNKFTP